MKMKKDEKLEQILLGSLLGDGGVYTQSRNTGFFSEVHSVKQRAYLLWKAKYFEKLGAKIRTYKQ